MEKTNETQPLVSVIMPTYNQSQFLGEAIESVLNQSYKHTELIIVDNYSEDNTEEVVKSFSDERIKYFKFRNNGIIAASRNFGMKKAQGEYIGFLDSDDLWLEEKVAAQMRLFRKYDDVGLTFCAFKIKSPERLFSGRTVGPYRKEICGYMYDRLILYNFIISSSAMIRSSMREEFGGFDESPQMRYVEDFDLWLRIARRYRIAGIPEVMGIYRMHAANLSMDGRRLNRTLVVIERHHKNGWILDRLHKKVRVILCFREGWGFAGRDGVSARSFFHRVLRKNDNSLKMVSLSLAGILLSFFPPLCRFLKIRSVDKKLANLILK